MSIDKKTVKTIAITAAIGLGVGAIVTAVIITKGSEAHILKEAKWTPQGDMMLTFYNKAYAVRIPKPE